jgi:hypothetical protein
MAKVSFAEENKAKNEYDYPKLWLDHNERARIVCIEQAPEAEYIHTLRAPVIVNGEVTMESVKGRDGSMTERPKYEFVGRHLCFGNANILAETAQKGQAKDIENCPTCAAADRSDAIGAATRRFAMHVVQYKTQPGSFKPQTPFNAELVIWSFTDRTFSQLTDIMVEHGDLRKKDLLLGPCENKGFQKFDIGVGGSAEWLASEENTNFVKRLYAENKVEDLTPMIARKVSKEMAQDDVEKVLMKHAQAFGGGERAAGAASAASMDLDNLLAGGGGTPAPAVDAPVQETPAAAEAAPAASDPLDFGTMDLGGTAPSEPDSSFSTPTPEPAAETAPAPAEEKKDPLDFGSLLEGL